MADRDQQQVPQTERVAPDENAVEDLEVREEEAAEVKGGASLNYTKVEHTYTSQG
jgi:hypothetical protein